MPGGSPPVCHTAPLLPGGALLGSEQLAPHTPGRAIAVSEGSHCCASGGLRQSSVWLWPPLALGSNPAPSRP